MADGPVTLEQGTEAAPLLLRRPSPKVAISSSTRDGNVSSELWPTRGELSGLDAGSGFVAVLEPCLEILGKGCVPLQDAKGMAAQPAAEPQGDGPRSHLLGVPGAADMASEGTCAVGMTMNLECGARFHTQMPFVDNSNLLTQRDRQVPPLQSCRILTCQP